MRFEAGKTYRGEMRRDGNWQSITCVITKRTAKTITIDGEKRKIYETGDSERTESGYFVLDARGIIE